MPSSAINISDEELVTMYQVDECQLPPQMRALVNIIGLPETVKLLRAKGGHRLLIPLGKKEETLLHDLISDNAVEKLCKSDFAGQRLTLPKVDKILNQIRDHHIRSMPNVAKAVFATQYNLTQRHVQRLRNTTDDNPTLDMFDDSMQ